MPAGGVVAPDGRPPQAKGVGKTARRHDLEAPATPGILGSDLQHGDAQRLEAAQRAAPRPKKQNGGGQRSAPKRRRSSASSGAEVPDPIEFAASRPGKPFDSTATGAPGPPVDPEPWMPMIRQMALHPQAGGAISGAYMRLLQARRQRPQGPTMSVMDLQELDDILMEG